MKWRVPLLTAVLLFAAAAFAQTDNTIYVRNFAGATVGAKVSAAQATCGPNTVVPCILVIDPSLAAWATGTMPTLCSHCYLWDFRSGPPTDVGSIATVFTNNGSALTAATSCGLAVSGGQLTAVTLTSDGTSGGATVDIKTESLSAWLAGTSPTSITNGHPLTFSAAKGVQVTSFTGWTSSTITAGQVYCFALSSPSSILGLNVQAVY